MAHWVAVISAVGFCQPTLIGPDGCILAGLAQVVAVERLGLSQVPVVRPGEPLGPEQNASRVQAVGLDLKAGALGVLGGLVWLTAVHSRHEVAWVQARAWCHTSNAEDLAALKAAKASRSPAVFEAAASELAALQRRVCGDWADHAVAQIPCGHPGPGCFGGIPAHLEQAAMVPQGLGRPVVASAWLSGVVQ